MGKEHEATRVTPPTAVDALYATVVVPIGKVLPGVAFATT